MLDPHQLVLASVPDKLLIMTYLHQIKQYFTTEAKPLVDDDNDVDDQCNDITMAAISEAGKTFIPNSGNVITDFETNNDLEKGLPNVVSEKESIGDLRKDLLSEKLVKLQYEPKPGYNPFDDEPMVDTSTDIDQNKTTVHSDCGKLRTKLSDNSAAESSSKDKVPVSDKDPSDFQTENQVEKRNAPRKPEIPVEDDKTIRDVLVHGTKVDNPMVKKQTNDTPNYSSKPEIVDSKKICKPLTEKQTKNTNTHASSKLEIKQDAHIEVTKISSHPQREKQADRNKIAPDKLKINEDETTPENMTLHSPKPGYNPFLDDEKENSAVKSENHSNINEPLNPFDDDYEKKILQQSAQVEEIRKLTAEVEKMRSLNPFDDDYDEIPEITKVDKSEVVSAVVSTSSSTPAYQTNNGTELAPSPVTSRKTGNAKVTNMHRKQIRRPASLASTVTAAKVQYGTTTLM